MGSGAAVSTALARAICGGLGHLLDNETLNPIIFEVEKIHHGVPSGIDNTVIVYEKPVYFVRGQPIETDYRRSLCYSSPIPACLQPAWQSEMF
jgi:mevalonate kinase